MIRRTSTLACGLALPLCLSAGLFLLSGCATAPRTAALLTYESNPLGATLYEGGQSIGVAPVTRSYAADPATGAVRTPDVTAVWPSGAKTTFWTNLKVGDDRVATLERPQGAPNLALDEANAKQYATEEARRREQVLREEARASARCQAQQQGTGMVAGIDDCH